MSAPRTLAGLLASTLGIPEVIFADPSYECLRCRRAKEKVASLEQRIDSGRSRDPSRTRRALSILLLELDSNCATCDVFTCEIAHDEVEL